MVTSVITLFRTSLPYSSTPAANPVIESFENSVPATINSRLPADGINERSKINEEIVAAAVEHNRESATVKEEDSEKTVVIEKGINDAEQDTDNTADIVDDNDSDNVLARGIFFEIFGCLPIFFVIYWPLFLFLITKICNVAQTSKITPRVAQPM